MLRFRLVSHAVANLAVFGSKPLRCSTSFCYLNSNSGPPPDPSPSIQENRAGSKCSDPNPHSCVNEPSQACAYAYANVQCTHAYYCECASDKETKIRILISFSPFVHVYTPPSRPSSPLLPSPPLPSSFSLFLSAHPCPSPLRPPSALHPPSFLTAITRASQCDLS